MTRNASIFISYSHDSDTHRAFVRNLANDLRRDGLDCQIDQYVNGFPPEGWQRWMETQIEHADFVLIVCTPLYLQRYRGIDPEGGRGVNFEGVVISQTLYDHYYRNTKFIPVIPGEGSLDDVPLPLKGFTTYKLPQDYTPLYRVLTDQHATPAPPVGNIIYLPPEVPGGLALNVNIAQEAVQLASYTNLPETATQSLLQQLHEQLLEQKRNNHNLSDLLDRYKKDVAEWEKKYRDALSQNAIDLEKHPGNPLLEAEQHALQAGELEQAAQIREHYYQNLKQEKTVELAQEAYTAAERWENAFNMLKALALYQEAVEFRHDYPQAWRNIRSIARKLGNNTLALEAAQSLQKQLDPEKDAEWFSVALSDEADILRALGDNRKAFQQYRQSQSLLEQLVKAEPDNLHLQRELSVDYNKIGDMHRNSGDNAAALKAYQESLAIRKRLAELDPNHPDWQRDLSVSHNKVGGMHLSSGDNAAALKAYQDGLAIAKKLAELDPNHTDWQRDLSVSYERVGDMHRNSRDNATALKAYQESLAIRKKLAELDPNHTEWQRDLSVSYDLVGDMHPKSGDNAAALKAYQESLAIRKKLAELDPAVVEWQTDLVVSYVKLAQIEAGRRKELLTDALAILYRLQREKRLDHEKQKWIGELEQALQPIVSGRDEPPVKP
ncbi:tetratricopeptide repeat protein [Nitrosomonas oligotropha]|uniref:tetratricopeptide repeat protein n=1 Tax=Nitrosomonas oligotropha TaxID=42354 RepID=UPI00136F46D8|nr:SEFIR domain-containing protein [Nitrosomonas oligotropha]MXS82623.1 TIR domain-containing protein [Nitrosomonas oligotropha]